MSKRTCQRGARLTGACAGLFILAGCATSAENCDATQGSNVFTATGCVYGGGYQARIDQLEQQAVAIRRDVALTEAEIGDLRAEAAALEADRSALRRAVQAQQRENAALRAEIDQLGQSNAIDAAENEVLQQRLDELSEAELELSTATNAEEIARLQQDIEERQAQIEAMRNIFVAE